MKRQFKRLAVIAITAVMATTTMAGLTGCQLSDKSYKSEDGNTIKLQYAKNFNIEYLENNNKIVTDGEGKQMLLLQKGRKHRKSIRICRPLLSPLIRLFTAVLPRSVFCGPLMMKVSLTVSSAFG